MQNPRRMLYIWTRFLADESGQDLVEYALLLALIALCVVASMGAVADDINNTFNTVASEIAPYSR